MKIKKISKVWYIVIVLVVLAIAGWQLSRCSGTKEEVSFSFEKVGPSTIQNSITATGTVEPVICDTVGTQISGIVSKIYVVVL